MTVGVLSKGTPTVAISVLALPFEYALLASASKDYLDIIKLWAFESRQLLAQTGLRRLGKYDDLHVTLYLMF